MVLRTSFERNLYIKFIPVFIFIGTIFIDSLNGYLQEFIGIHTPIGVVVRGGILFILYKYLLNTSNLISQLLWIIVWLYILSIPLWFINGSNLNIGFEVNYLFRFLYFFVVIFYFYCIRDEIDIFFLIRIIVYAALIIAVLNIICLFTGLGIKSYGENYGFGIKAFYADGNSLGLYMIMSNCFAVWYAFYKKNRWLVYAVIITAGTMLIGSRASIVGSVVVWLAMLLYILLKKDRFVKISRCRKFILCILLGGGVMYGIISLYGFISQFDEYTVQKFSSDSVLSPRENLINCGKSVINEFDFLEKIVGKGYSGGAYELAKKYSTESDYKIVEADIYDMVLMYGYGLGGLIILIHFLLFYNSIIAFIRFRSSLTFAVLISTTLWFGASYMAGHGFANVMLAPIFGVVYIICLKAKNESRFKSSYNRNRC